MKEKKLKPFKLSGNAIVDRRELIRLLVDYLGSFGYDSGTVVGGLTLCLHHADHADKIRLLASSDAFREGLLTECLEKSIGTDERFAMEVVIGEPPKASQEVRQGIWLLLKSAGEVKSAGGEVKSVVDSPIVHTKARITVLKGDLYQSVYHLDAAQQSLYNIGRGQQPQLSGGAFSVNHIAIREETHRSISREHAAILFLPDLGFCLAARRGGTTIAGNATCLFHANGEGIELIDTTQRLPLQHGDQIKLGARQIQSVILLFEREE
ncbi:MAG: FHA domain-containing protein [Prevotellaceae bacterium]|jgi:hypothetical protein|nr:FHA domain-containing protein [Prevotellaceae bacterium]